jgi:hypothetical protein
MAPSAVSLETESEELGLQGSKNAAVEQPERAVHGAEGLTPIQAISHGPITIGGASFFLLFPIATDELYGNSKDQARCTDICFHSLPSFSRNLVRCELIENRHSKISQSPRASPAYTDTYRSCLSRLLPKRLYRGHVRAYQCPGPGI